MNPPEDPDYLKTVRSHCPKCKYQIQFPEGYEPEINTIFQCPICSSNIGIIDINDTGVEEKISKNASKTKKDFTFVIIPESRMEELDLDNRLEEVFHSGSGEISNPNLFT